MKTVDLYKEIEDIADRLEDIRILLYNNAEHIANFEEEFKNFDDNMFRLQSELRNLVSDELDFYNDEEHSETYKVDRQIIKILSSIIHLNKLGVTVLAEDDNARIEITGKGADNDLDNKCVKIF